MSRRILVVRRDNIGDLVLTTPLFAALRAKMPDATIDVLTNSYAAPVLAGNPHLNALYVYTKAHHRDAGESWLGVYLRRVRTVLELRRRRYDTILLAKVPAERRPLQFARMIGAEEIVGLVKPGDAPLPGLTHLYEWDPVRDSHTVQALMQLGRHFGIAEPGGPTLVRPEPRAQQKARAFLAPVVERGAPVVVLNLSARKVKQRWPVARFVALARALHEREDASFMLVWSPGAPDNPRHPGDDDKAAEAMHGLAGLPCVAVRTAALPELIAALSLADAMVTADGGAMHLGAACGLPVVALFGNSDPAMWHPWHVPHEVLQHPARDVNLIEVDDVLGAWGRLRVQGGVWQGRARRSDRDDAPAPPDVISR
jgi:ADP-heptose:LPS heptosyltransferase